MATQLPAAAPIVLESRPDFEVFLRTVETHEDDGKRSITVTASSDEIDLGSDRFTLSALKQMEVAFPGLTIFLNHRYSVPEDVFGSVAVASLVPRDGHTDLDLNIVVDEKNPRAIQTFEMIKDGRHLGVSVGVIVVDADFCDEEVAGKKVLELTSIIPLEASIVGIPANRRSWVQNALKAAGLLAAKGGRVIPLSDLGAEGLAIWTPNGFYRLPDIPEEANRMTTPDNTNVQPDPTKAEWTRAYINNLPDSAFATILDGGKKDSEGKTKPRSLRKLPHHDDSGKVDEPHLNNALSREPQTNMPEANHKKAKAHLKRHKGKSSLTSAEIAALDAEYGADHFGDAPQTVAVGEAITRSVLESASTASSMLQAAIAMHQQHMDDPEAATEESQAEMMQMLEDCLEEVGSMHGQEEGVAASAVALPGPGEKSLRDDLAATEFADKFYYLFRALYTSLFEIIATETSSEVKRGEAQRVVNEFGTITMEMVEDVLSALDNTDDDEEARENQMAFLKHFFATGLAALEGWPTAKELPVPQVVSDGSPEIVAQVPSLITAIKALEEKNKTLEASLAEQVQLAVALYRGLNEVMEMPLARKCVPEKVLSDLSEKFPWLDERVIAGLARVSAE